MIFIIEKSLTKVMCTLCSAYNKMCIMTSKIYSQLDPNNNYSQVVTWLFIDCPLSDGMPPQTLPFVLSFLHFAPSFDYLGLNFKIYLLLFCPLFYP